jgi:hypothetical protein
MELVPKPLVKIPHVAGLHTNCDAKSTVINFETPREN